MLITKYWVLYWRNFGCFGGYTGQKVRGALTQCPHLQDGFCPQSSHLGIPPIRIYYVAVGDDDTVKNETPFVSLRSSLCHRADSQPCWWVVQSLDCGCWTCVDLPKAFKGIFREPPWCLNGILIDKVNFLGSLRVRGGKGNSEQRSWAKV